MSRIYESLRAFGTDLAENGREATGHPPCFITENVTDECMMSLVQCVLAVNTDGNRVVGMIGLPAAADTYCFVRHFARVAMHCMGSAVQLVEVGRKTHFGALSRRMRGKHTVAQKASTELPRPPLDELTIQQIKLSQFADKTTAGPGLTDVAAQWRGVYALTVIYIPGFASSADLICPCLDGVALVVESEKVRRQTLAYYVRKVSAHKCRFLGTALIKQRHYIPQYLYRRL